MRSAKALAPLTLISANLRQRLAGDLLHLGVAQRLAQARPFTETTSTAPTFQLLPDWFKNQCRTFAASAQPSEAEDHEDRNETDDGCAQDTTVGISSMESSRRRREAKVAELDFLAETSDIDEGPIGLYRKGLHDHIFRPDEAQEHTVRLLHDVYEKLKAAHPHASRRPSGLTMVDSVSSEANASSSGSWWSNFMSNDSSSDSQNEGSGVKGMYMYGGVGCGKTMLMDLLVSSAPREFKLRRAHFHDFMLDVHSRLQHHRTASDTLVTVADEISEETRVLCMDEFFVTDVADAVILNRLFSRLFEKGVVLVATSNRQPDALYEGGLQRMLFLPFIDRLKAQCTCHNMDSATDYRRLAQHQLGMYFTDPKDRQHALEHTFEAITNQQPVAPATLTVQMGRKLQVDKAGGCICYFTFKELCGKPVAAADYIALAESYHSVAIEGVPVVTAANRSEAYRFMILIDVLYEHRVRFFCSAEADPFELFEKVVAHKEYQEMGTSAPKDLVVDDNLGFTKDRTISRLIEMQSHEYLVAHAERHAPELLLALSDRKANPRSSRQGRQERGGLRSSSL